MAAVGLLCIFWIVPIVDYKKVESITITFLVAHRSGDYENMKIENLVSQYWARASSLLLAL